MPSVLQFLVVENEEPWQRVIRRVLESLGGDVRVDIAPNLESARHLIDKRTYDLATLDLSLLGRAPGPDTADELGLELVEKFLGSERNQQIGILILTGYSTPDRVRRAFRRYRVQDVIEKFSFTPESFRSAVQAALLETRLLKAERRLSSRHALTVSFNQTSWLGSQLRGPHQHNSTYIAERPTQFEAEDLARRADQLNLLIGQEVTAKRGSLWRPEARSIGRAIYQAFQEDRRIFSDFERARMLASQGDPLWLRFSGPPAGLGLPFELMRGDGDPLCFEHIFEREISAGASTSARKPVSFDALLRDISERGTALRVLILGANSDGKIPTVEEEVTYLQKEISLELGRLGLVSEVQAVIGSKANRKTLREALSEGFQIVHYAGHGRFKDSLPEVSGLILGEGMSTEVVTAAELKQLAAGSELCFVFLSCCLGARTSPTLGHGDFHGTLQALAQAGVAKVLGYRWTVTDHAALSLAQAFYGSLWRTFSPGHALLEARLMASAGPEGRDDETWASPILLSQTA